MSQRGWAPDPWLSSPGERERNAVMAIRVEVNMLQFCSVSNSPSHTTLSIKWEVDFSKELCRLSLLCRCYDSACIYVCIVGHGYTTNERYGNVCLWDNGQDQIVRLGNYCCSSTRVASIDENKNTAIERLSWLILKPPVQTALLFAWAKKGRILLR